MKFNGYSFPHPVLGLNDDIEGSASVEKLEYDEITDEDNYILTIIYKLDNPDFLQMLAENKAQFVCELSCTATLFRKTELSDSLIQKITIPKNFVRETVELLFLLISTDSISNYSNSKIHQDFAGYTFDIDKGDVLAFLGEGKFIAGIAYKKLQAVSSFLEIDKRSDDETDMNIILDNPKVLIQLSKKDYEKYCEPRIGRSTKYASIFHSSVVLPALIHALYQLIRNEDLEEQHWAKIIISRIQNDPSLNGLQLEEDNVLKIVQLLIGLPINRLLEDLHTEITSNTDTEN
jgi:hypothetical protein